MQATGTLTLEQIKEILPHREPFLFIDRVLEIDTDKCKVIAQKRFLQDDYFFAGHFPGNPIVPGVIIVESMAQASIVLFAALKPAVAAKKPTYYFGKADVRFKNAVFPGDNLRIEITGVKIIDTLGIVEAVAKTGEKTAVEGTLGFGVKVNKH